MIDILLCLLALVLAAVIRHASHATRPRPRRAPILIEPTQTSYDGFLELAMLTGKTYNLPGLERAARDPYWDLPGAVLGDPRRLLYRDPAACWAADPSVNPWRDPDDAPVAYDPALGIAGLMQVPLGASTAGGPGGVVLQAPPPERTEAELEAATAGWDTITLADRIEPPPFKPEEPRTFAEYAGQPHIIVPLEKAVQALPPEQDLLDHKLFTGLPGLGKTLIAKVIANVLSMRAQALGRPGVRFFWSFAANLHSAELLDRFVRELITLGGGVWFIDEIHVLDRHLQTKIYSLMEDGVYPFEGDMAPTPVPPVMVIGATTEYGGLVAALKRRFGETMMLRPMAAAQIRALLATRRVPIADDAADLLVDRTRYSGAPWEAITLHRECAIFAKAAGRALVTATDVLDVLAAFGIDDLGLRWEDREVLRALFQRPRYRGKDQLFVCYGASESDLCAVARLDPEEYRTAIKPRLLARGLIEVRTGYGQALTEGAVTRYRATLGPDAPPEHAPEPLVVPPAPAAAGDGNTRLPS